MGNSCRRFLFLLLSFQIILPAFALEKPENELIEVGVRTILGNKVDLNLRFSDADGKEVSLKELFLPGKPAIILPAYYHCPRLCTLVMSGMAKAISGMSLKLNKDYRVITVSFDPEETPKQAADKGEAHRMLIPKTQDGLGWRFLVGTDQNIKPLMHQVGFYYKKDDDEFAHSAAIMILTPTGEISQYFTGIEFSPFDVKLALIEAAKGEIGSPLDHIFLFCFRFDETKGRYTWAAFNLMRAGAALTLFLLVGLILTLWRREKMRAKSLSVS